VTNIKVCLWNGDSSGDLCIYGSREHEKQVAQSYCIV